MMKVTYLSHSGFAVEYENCVLIFDYYKGSVPDFDKRKNIYVFVSHAHGDHFNRCIFRWAEEYGQITYILSEDVPFAGDGPKGDALKDILRVSPGGDYKTGELAIRTLRSTDEGVAFLVHVKGRVIYHGGDLNWWHWKEESEQWNASMAREYPDEIGKIKGERIDIAFLPLDPRQEEAFFWGFDYFMRNTDTAYAFPMHMWGRYGTCEKLLEIPEARGYREKVMCVQKEGQEFLLESV